MSKELNTRIAGIVAAHKDHMTFKDMAEEFDIAESTIRAYCAKNGIEVVSAKQYKINYIRDMAGKHSTEWIAEKLGIKPGHVRILADENKIFLICKTSFINEAAPLVETPGINTGKWSRSLILAELQEHIEDRVKGDMPGTHTIKTELTQGPSPFGLADEVVGRRFK